LRVMLDACPRVRAAANSVGQDLGDQPTDRPIQLGFD
jgi:hypothetical protein